MDFLKMLISMDHHERGNVLVVSENKLVSLSSNQLSSQTCCSMVPIEWRWSLALSWKYLYCVTMHPFWPSYHFLCPYSTYKNMISQIISMKEARTFLLIISHTLLIDNYFNFIINVLIELYKNVTAFHTHVKT